MAHDEEQDPGLPIQFGPASNGEFDPEPSLPSVLRETIARAKAWSVDNADRLGMSRREFLLSACGAATAFRSSAISRTGSTTSPARIPIARLTTWARPPSATGS